MSGINGLILQLGLDALNAGDLDLAALCYRASEGDRRARAKCLRAIADAEDRAADAADAHDALLSQARP